MCKNEKWNKYIHDQVNNFFFLKGTSVYTQVYAKVVVFWVSPACFWVFGLKDYFLDFSFIVRFIDADNVWEDWLL